MSQHLALFHFASQLNVRGEVLGSIHYVEREGHGVLLTFPAAEGDFGPVGRGDTWGEGLFRAYQKASGKPVAAMVKILQVAVVVESEASSEQDTEAGRVDGSRALREGFRIARGVVADFYAWTGCSQGNTGWIRATGQSASNATI